MSELDPKIKMNWPYIEKAIIAVKTTERQQQFGEAYPDAHEGAKKEVRDANPAQLIKKYIFVK